ncbi:hypothetical protein LEP1GSC073_1563 [Leptospira noguchii str. Cascata]|nr:hypothetical protein LEP1GSC073_1563 [Leptospira noguchii str. Cascata]
MISRFNFQHVGTLTSHIYGKFLIEKIICFRKLRTKFGGVPR